jgi:hypothetical protein
MTTGMLCIRNSIDEDSWTEISDLIKGFLKIINDETGETYELHKDSLSRLVIILSQSLVEIIFWETCARFVSDQGNSILEDLFKYTQKKTKFRNAIEDLPKKFQVNGINFGQEPFQSLNLLIQNRNKLIHENTSELMGSADSAYASALKCSIKIWENFFPDEDFIYKDWIDESYINSQKTFQQSVNERRENP